MLSLLVALAVQVSPVHAAPPSTRLDGPDGTLSWTVTAGADAVTIDGRSPKWRVEHVAGVDLTPRRTTHTDVGGASITVVYTPAGAEVTRDGQTTTIPAPGAWDADTLDVRLGARMAAGSADFEFTAIDAAGAKAYTFDATRVGAESCGSKPCIHARVQLAGLLKYLGPTWEYWYAADGRLVRFSGPIGTFAAEDAR